MAPKQRSRKGVLWLVIALALVIGIASVPSLVSHVETTRLRSVFAEQNQLLSKAIGTLGITGTPRLHFQCPDDGSTHWRARLMCQNFANYPYNSSPISPQAKANYPANAARLDTLLRQNGWVNDRPQDSVTTLVGSNPYAAQNGGQGGNVPFHKNVGTISCNFEISFDGLSPDRNASPGAINVNEFSCSQPITYFMPRLSTGHRLEP